MTPLHYIGDFLRAALGAVPLTLVRALFVGTLIALLVWVLRLPAEATSPPGGAKRWDENLKVGAAVALVLQILIYLWW
ncbi:MAG: hypothetical protein KDB14_30660 [Planctomycetales bacterium]|nr:hypothetical protein [Planctomycetales bacterium]